MRLYICYAEVDSFLVRSLAESLRAAHHEVWLADQILPGQNPDTARQNAIQRAGAFIYALTPESAASRAVPGRTRLRAAAEQARRAAAPAGQRPHPDAYP